MALVASMHLATTIYRDILAVCIGKSTLAALSATSRTAIA